MKTQKQDMLKTVMMVLLAILILSTIQNRPIFLGALTSFTQTGNELEFTEAMVQNGTATITRELKLDHGNVSSAHIEFFPTPTITDLVIKIDDAQVWQQQANESVINVIRLDITENLKRATCQNCIVPFKFISSNIGSVLVTEVNVDYGVDPNVQVAEEQPDPQPVSPPVPSSENPSENNTGELASQPSAQMESNILLYGIIITLIFLLWEKGPNNGFFKSI